MCGPSPVCQVFVRDANQVMNLVGLPLLERFSPHVGVPNTGVVVVASLENVLMGA